MVEMGPCLHDQAPTRVGRGELTEEGLVVPSVRRFPSGPGRLRVESWADSAGSLTWDPV